MKPSSPTTSRSQTLTVAVMSLIILGFCAYGFGTKFFEFVMLVKSTDSLTSESVFAVTPIVNYLLASAGFLCMLGWAAYHGMFRDIELPKRTMLDLDQQLDAGASDTHFSDSVLNYERRRK